MFFVGTDEFTLTQFLYHSLPCLTAVVPFVKVSLVVSVKSIPKTQTFSFAKGVNLSQLQWQQVTCPKSSQEEEAGQERSEDKNEAK